MFGHATTREIVWRGHDMRAERRPDFYRDHVSLDHVAKTDTRIEPSADDIDQLTFDDDFQADIRIGREKFSQYRLQRDHVSATRHIQPQKARPLFRLSPD